MLLKTELWLNTLLLKNKCGDRFSTVVYIYSQDTSKQKEVEQEVLSNTLRELKEKRGNDIILIPLAGDLDLGIVNLQLDIYDVSYFPSVIINEKHVLEGFHSLEELEKYLIN